jgi:hypothetical protein
MHEAVVHAPWYPVRRDRAHLVLGPWDEPATDIRNNRAGLYQRIAQPMLLCSLFARPRFLFLSFPFRSGEQMD